MAFSPFPSQGDIIYINFNPSLGREIQHRRPALVISKDAFNKSLGFCLVCPITTTVRAYKTYIPIIQPKTITGEVVTHQIRAIDFTKRNLQVVEKCDPITWANVLATIDQFI